MLTGGSRPLIMETSVLRRFPLTQCAFIFTDYRISLNIEICDFTLRADNDTHYVMVTNA